MRARRSAPAEAARLLKAGREALTRGARREAMARFHAAMRLDPAVACEGWGLLPLLEAEGRGSFRDRMLARMQSWYGTPPSAPHRIIAGLSNKGRMRRFIAAQGLPLPALYAEAETLAKLDWAVLPSDRLVIKPQNAASNAGVVIACHGKDLMTGAPLLPDLPGYARALYAREFENQPPVMAEACLHDVGAKADPLLLIPRDFKVFTVAGMAVFVRVHDRNAEGGRRWMATYDRNGKRRPAALTGWDEAPPEPVPPGFDSMIDMAETLSRQLPWLLRLDFYLTPSGPVFGEFTSFPNAGLDCTPFGRRTLLQMWEIWPDG